MKPSLKYRLIEQNIGKYPIERMCIFYGVSRSGYYCYRQHKDIPAKDIPLAELIAECQSKRGKIHGYRYIHLWLEKEKGVYRNPKTVLRVMRKYGLLSEVRRKRWQACGQSVHRYANVLNRNFKSEQPNKKWVTDISYIPTAQGFLYLSIIRDLFDNSIVAYKTSRQQTVNLVLDTVRAAVQKEAETLMTTLWQKISSPCSRLSASPCRKFSPLSKRSSSLMTIFISTILSVTN